MVQCCVMLEGSLALGFVCMEILNVFVYLSADSFRREFLIWVSTTFTLSISYMKIFALHGSGMNC